MKGEKGLPGPAGPRVKNLDRIEIREDDCIIANFVG